MGVTTWDELADLANPSLRALVEANPRAHYPAGESWISEGSDTYSHVCFEVKVSATADDGQEMTEKSNLADVKSTAGSWWFDKANQVLYVHCFDNDNLSSSSTDTVVVAFVWKYFSTDACEFNGVQYMPIIRQNSLPMLDLSVDDIVEGAYKFNFGSFKMNNPGWFDKAADDYLWTNCKMLIKLGGEDLPYTEYIVYFGGRASNYYVKDEEVIFTVKDIRVGAYAAIPIDHYWLSNYPKLETGAEGLAIPVFYGIKTNIIPVCIDSNRVIEPYGDPPYPTGSKWKIAGSRKIKEFTEIRLNFGDIDYSVPLIENTHYTTDLNNAEFTLLIPLIEGDTLEVDAKGYVIDGGVLMETGGEIAKDILKTYLDYIDDDLDLDSFDNVDTVRPYEQCIYLDVDRSSRQVLQTIGRGVVSFFTPTEEGKLAFVSYEETVPADVMKLEDRDFGEDWQVGLNDTFLRNKIKFQYDQNPKTQEFKVVEKNNYEVLYKYGVRETLILETYLREDSDANSIATAIRNMCSNPVKIVDTSCGIKAFKLFPTMKVKVSRKRAVDSSGAWDEKVFRVRQVVKNTNTERTYLVLVDDFQSMGDVPHVDVAHTHTPHSNVAHSHTPYQDTSHQDTPHSHTPHGDSAHIHTSHSDWHGDMYGDGGGEPHGDMYYDTPHIHTPHEDTPHSHAPHLDVPYEDSPYTDTPHSHTPHSDSPHTHVPHQDTPHIHTF